MMKLAFSSNGLKPLSKQHAVSRVCKLLFHSTSKPKKGEGGEGGLSQRISLVVDSKASIVPVLDQWYREGKNVNEAQLHSLIKQLKSSKRHKHALEISQWMTDRWFINPSVRDYVVRLELIAKVHGIEQAENYFNSIAAKCIEEQRIEASQLYHSLLECYVQSKSVDKAEFLMEQMRKLGLVTSSVVFNSMLKLYAMVEQYEKMDRLMEEMNKKNVYPDKFTFSIRLNAYAATVDISGMEKLLQWMEADPNVVINSTSYTISANGYIKAGLAGKALGMLKKLEELISVEKGKRFGYNYHCMIASLLKLEDIAGAETIVQEWETRDTSNADTSNDFRIPNMLVVAYCKKTLLKKAEMFINRSTEKGKKLFASTWEILASSYVEANQTPKAVEALNASLLARPGWKPPRETLDACLLYLKQKGDAGKTEELVRLLGIPHQMSADDSARLLDYLYNKEAEVGKVNKDAFDNEEETDVMDSYR
ncbi:hypothetical protein AQUCO_14100001v1 [Aquilegia coerulea]|uniref:Pentacotripeptide-repeat region of PRORP domain-containing protein n=1 Tax=Aquilegia coerulea TaxID=218851 RepID=A0A2G5C0Z6_AQUCA|nr:hypothetical protein AQUCO_14100001v1 [Aquilegia coerulea]